MNSENKLKTIYEKLKTPFYILDEEKLNNNYYSLKNAFEGRWGENFIIGYSFKTNSTPWLLDWMKKNGAYAEVVSEAEYKLAMKLGFDKKNVVINGPVKGYDALRETLNNGAIVNLDSFHEIEYIKNNPPENGIYKVGLRINFDLERECASETIMGNEPGRFGFNVENGSFSRAVQMLKELEYVKIVGLHGHHSTKTKSLKIFEAICKELVKCSKELDFLEYIDIGGCIFGDKPGAPTFEEYASTIVGILEKEVDKEKVTLIVEPGAAIVASPFKYLCKVLDEKEVKGKSILSTDGSLIHIDPQMHGIKFYLEAFSSGNKKVNEQIISGFTCIEKDRMAILKDENEICIGDKILFHNTGAYSMALSPLFIQYYPAIYLESNGAIYLIREPWNEDDYINKSILGYTRPIEE